MISVHFIRWTTCKWKAILVELKTESTARSKHTCGKLCTIEIRNQKAVKTELQDLLDRMALLFSHDAKLERIYCQTNK